ncbi:LysM peptidoglycan-binding domain-containing protein [Flagellimonas onchidii]|uniref:LysM peptidoglycan-binding domain-containing protein n=1 Tax=Flagellimonas onchidii TaxID=2562684 RepID=UPI0010A68110|nr:LysM domain-containing protein [Allomuricauda onchidii]
MRLLPTFLLWVSITCTLFAQSDYYTVKAEPGDGIYSILRKQGLDPVTHYEKFIKLNIKNIKDGSRLHVGREYKIPNVLDSFKKTGVVVKLESEGETPIFDEELGQMSLKSRTLKDAVYYLIVESASMKNNFITDITKNLAASLMVHGAQVFVFGNIKVNTSTGQPENTEKEKLEEYIDAINKRYLQNAGKYQRLLVIRANGSVENGKMDVAVYHHGKSKNGERFAKNIQEAFKNNSIESRSYKNVERIFQDQNSLYLATNTLPAVSLLTIDNGSKTLKKDGIKLRSDKKAFANWITNGILRDYAEITIDE